IADPYAFPYKKAMLDQDPRWFEKNILGSGPFRFKEYEAGQSISGVRNPDYYRKGLPYLDGFTGIFADKQAVRVSAIRGDRAAIRDKTGTGAARRLRARYREIEGRGTAPAEGSGAGEPQFRAPQPQCRPTLQIPGELGHRRLEQDRGQGDPARIADRPLHRGGPSGRVRCVYRRRVPEHRQPAARRDKVPAAFGFAGE